MQCCVCPCLEMASVQILVTSTVTVLKAPPAQAIAADMVRASQMGFVSATVVELVLTAPQPFVTSSAVCMAGSATMVNVRCSDYAGYTCQNSSTLISSLSICGDVLSKEAFGQHCAPSEPSILHQLEAAVVMPNYNRLMPSARSLISIIDNGYCSAAEKRLAWWISIQRCDKDGDSRLGVCRSASRSYNAACAAALDCSDQTLFGGGDEKDEQCTGSGKIIPWWARCLKGIYSQ